MKQGLVMAYGELSTVSNHFGCSVYKAVLCDIFRCYYYRCFSETASRRLTNGRTLKFPVEDFHMKGAGMLFVNFELNP